MKEILITNHAIDKYASRTGRRMDSSGLILGLVNDIKQKGVQLSIEEARVQGFNIQRYYRGDIFIVWHDDFINEDLLGIVAKDGSLKTVFRHEMFSYREHSKYNTNVTKGRVYNYGGQSKMLSRRAK